MLEHYSLVELACAQQWSGLPKLQMTSVKFNMHGTGWHLASASEKKGEFKSGFSLPAEMKTPYKRPFDCSEYLKRLHIV